MGAHSAIPAEHVQSQVARATANNLNICQDESRRRSNKNCKQTGLQYFPAIPGRFRWLPTSTICLILLFVTSCTLRQVQKTKSSYSVEYTVALLATVGFRTWVILPTQLTQTCLPAKQKHVQWERYQGTICTFRSTIYGTFLYKKRKIADASFRTGKQNGELRTLSTLRRQLAKGRLRSNKRVQQCNGDLRQRAKQPQDPWTFVTMRKNILYIDFMPTASLLMMMFSPRLTNAKKQELNTKARKTHPPKK